MRKQKMIEIKIEHADGISVTTFKVPENLGANILPIVAHRFHHSLVTSPQVPTFDGSFQSVMESIGGSYTGGGCSFCGCK